MLSLRKAASCRIIGLILLLFLSSCSSEKTIVNGLDEKEANEIVVFLASKGIDSSKAPGKETGGGGGSKVALFDINVPADKANEAMAILNQNGLPRRRGSNLLGIFSNVGLVPSEMEQQIRYQAGLAEQIASTIRKIDGVLDAEVQISFPKEDPLNPGKTSGKISASVYVKHNGVLDDPNSHLITKIKRLVAASITGLDFDNVTVISDKARFGETGLSSASLGEEQKQYVSVWTIVVAKDSLFRFQVIFFSFCIIILLLLLILVWLTWKFFPILEKTGFKELTHLSPIRLDKKGEEEAAKIEDKKDDDTKGLPPPAASGEGEIEKGVDVT